jgi:hypothetical protein
MNFFSSVVKQESVVSEEELRWEVWARTGSAGLLQDQVKNKVTETIQSGFACFWEWQTLGETPNSN